jgi:hypothetical protein
MKLLAVISILAALNFWALYILSLRINRDLTSYVLFLLLSDDLRTRHRASFYEFIRDLKGAGAMDDYMSCRRAVERMAKATGKTEPLLGISAGIQEVKRIATSTS